MEQLRELPNARQVPGEPRRRWFNSPHLDLIVWFDASDKPLGFQLCYDKLDNERALTWREGRGYDHMKVDDGEAITPAQYKESPILMLDGAFDCARVKAKFEAASSDVPEAVRRFVIGRLEDYPGDTQ